MIRFPEVFIEVFRISQLDISVWVNFVSTDLITFNLAKENGFLY